MPIGSHRLLLPALTAAALCAAALCASCTHPGYRDEVYPGTEGQYTLKRVPITETAPPPPSASASAVTPTPDSTMPQSALPQQSTTPQTPAVATTPPPSPPEADAGLQTVRTLWPKLSASDRAAVVDMTRHLAGQ